MQLVGFNLDEYFCLCYKYMQTERLHIDRLQRGTGHALPALDEAGQMGGCRLQTASCLGASCQDVKVYANFCPPFLVKRAETGYLAGAEVIARSWTGAASVVLAIRHLSVSRSQRHAA